MSVLGQTFSFCLLIVAASSRTLYFVNDSYGVPPGVKSRPYHDENNIFSFDTDTNKLEIYEKMPQATVAINDPAIMCNDIYFAYEGSTSSKIGFIAFDSRSKQISTYSTTQPYPAFDVEALACWNSSSSIGGTQLLMVNSIETKDFVRYYQLALAHFDTSNGNLVTDSIGYLPSKYDYDSGSGSNIFQFNADGSELWIGATGERGSGAHAMLLIVDPLTANINQSYIFPLEAGTVYFTLPQTLDNGSFKAAMVPTDNVDVDFVTVEIQQNSNMLSVTREIVGADLYGDDMPSLAVCDGVGYIITERTGTVVEFDINTGKKMNEYNVATNREYLEMGSLAC